MHPPEKLGQRPALTALCLLVLLLMQAWTFSAGYRATADDIDFQNIAFQGFGHIVTYTQHFATSQGRIGQYISVPLAMLGSYWHDIFWVRALFVGLYFLLFYLVSLFVARLTQTKTALYLFVLMVSLTNIGPAAWNHLPPSSYPLLIAIPLLIIMGTKLWWQQKCENGLQPMGSQIIYGAIMLLAMLMNEFAFLFGSGLLLLEITAGFARRNRILRSHLVDVIAIALSLLIYILYRKMHPSFYAGNTPDGMFNLGAMLKTAAGHIISGTSIKLFLDFKSYPVPFAEPIQILRAVIFGLLTGALVDHFSRARELNKNLWPVIIGAFAFAAYTVLPSAITQKYQGWCMQGVCTYIDTRLAYFGLIIGLGLLYLCLPQTGAPQTLLLRALRWVVLFIIAAVAGHTYLNNDIVRGSMNAYTQAWVRAQNYACQPGFNPEAMPNLTQQIDPQGLVHYHPAFPADAYWLKYMHDYRVHHGCAQPPR